MSDKRSELVRVSFDVPDNCTKRVRSALGKKHLPFTNFAVEPIFEDDANNTPYNPALVSWLSLETGDSLAVVTTDSLRSYSKEDYGNTQVGGRVASLIEYRFYLTRQLISPYVYVEGGEHPSYRGPRFAAYIASTFSEFVDFMAEDSSRRRPRISGIGPATIAFMRDCDANLMLPETER